MILPRRPQNRGQGAGAPPASFDMGLPPEIPWLVELLHAFAEYLVLNNKGTTIDLGHRSWRGDSFCMPHQLVDAPPAGVSMILSKFMSMSLSMSLSISMSMSISMSLILEFRLNFSTEEV